MSFPKEILDSVHHNHVQQLAGVQPKLDKAPQDEDKPPVTSETLIQWINENKNAIQAAQASRCVSGSADTPNWDAVLFALIESTAIFFRDMNLVIAAAQAAQEGDTQRAVELLKESQKAIDDVAAALGCTFIQLCDFTQQGPDGLCLLNGAFCGAFISHTDPAKPFIGVTFKGTDSSREILNDVLWLPLQPTDVAFGAKTHTGFYNGLFGGFTQSGVSQVPFDIIVQQLDTIYNGNALLHFTGHSMGGAYATLAYGEFLRRGLGSTYTLGDAYLSATPRVCEQPFAQLLAGLTTNAGIATIRIVNDGDPIPTMPPPPPPLSNPDEFPYIHVDGAWKIFTDRRPVQMDTEQPNNPIPPQHIDGPFPQHGTIVGPELQMDRSCNSELFIPFCQPLSYRNI